MKRKCLMVFSVCLLALPTVAQQQAAPDIGGYGGGLDERGSARVLYWNNKTDGPEGQLAIDYGRPGWKKEYEDPAKFDGMTKGKVWRMGKDFWTTLDTSLPLNISGKAVPPGYYYLGLRRSADGGQWSLAFLDPVKVRAARLDGFVIDRAGVEFDAPVKVEKSAEIADKLTITLAYAEETPTRVTLKLAWGNLAMTAPVEVTLVK
jgi:hypothetical protein